MCESANSNTHFQIFALHKKAWWKAEGCGYTTKREEAGIYSTEDLASYNLVDFSRGPIPKGNVLILINNGADPFDD